jgi:hypothetical protein
VLALAALTLTTQVAIGVHEAAAQHVRCEHGELVDLAVAAATPSTGLASDTPVLIAANDASSGHEHCALASAPQGGLSFHHALASVGLPHRCLARAPGTEGPRARAIPLLALAPKGSPPTL